MPGKSDEPHQAAGEGRGQHKAQGKAICHGCNLRQSHGAAGSAQSRTKTIGHGSNVGRRRVVGVLDLLGGRVVRGVGGRRDRYQSVVSRLTASCQPRDVARAFRDHLDLGELYLADLDAIAGAQPAWEVYAALVADGFRLWVDAGLRETAMAVRLAEQGIESVVAGLETLPGPWVLAQTVQRLGEQLVFSLDLRDGSPLGDRTGWAPAEAAAIAEQAVGLGVRRILVLDLARVGTGGGTGTEGLCAQLARSYPYLEVSTGGGSRGRADLVRLHALGVRVVLVGSALHDAVLSRADLAALCGPRLTS